MGIREYAFNNAIETATLPSTTDPTASADLVSLGYLQTILGSGFTVITSATLTNNTAVAANVTGLTFAASSVKTAFIEYEIYRETTGGGAAEYREAGMLLATYRPTANSWTLTELFNGGQLAGVDFTITGTTTGQIKYTSTNEAGTPGTFTMKWRVRSF